MTKLNLLAFIYSIYLCSTIYIGAVPIGNHQNHFDGILLQKRLQILQQKHQQHYQQRNKYMNAALGTIKRGRPTSKDTIPTYMLDLYKYLSKHKDSKILHDGNTVRSYFDTGRLVVLNICKLTVIPLLKTELLAEFLLTASWVPYKASC